MLNIEQLKDENKGDYGGVIENRRVQLTADEQKEICPECGHTRGAHHNPDDRCCVEIAPLVWCNCGYYFYGKK